MRSRAPGSTPTTWAGRALRAAPAAAAPRRPTPASTPRNPTARPRATDRAGATRKLSGGHPMDEVRDGLERLDGPDGFGSERHPEAASARSVRDRAGGGPGSLPTTRPRVRARSSYRRRRWPVRWVAARDLLGEARGQPQDPVRAQTGGLAENVRQPAFELRDMAGRGKPDSTPARRSLRSRTGVTGWPTALTGGAPAELPQGSFSGQLSRATDRSPGRGRRNPQGWCAGVP